jgi:hypothetical protein
VEVNASRGGWLVNAGTVDAPASIVVAERFDPRGCILVVCSKLDGISGHQLADPIHFAIADRTDGKHF